MKQNLKPGAHPDADQLSIFVEGAAGAHERERMLEHLAECGECRQAVFLMRRRDENAASPAPARWEWRGQRWLAPAGLAGAVLACGLTGVLVYRSSHPADLNGTQQTAREQKPGALNGNAGPAPLKTAKAAQPEAQTNAPRQSATTPRRPQQDNFAAGPKRSNAQIRQAATEGANGPERAAGSASYAGEMAGELRVPAPAAPPVSAAVEAKMPPVRRNAMNLPPAAAAVPTLPHAAAAVPAQKQAPQVDSAAAAGLPVLKVQRQFELRGALSAVSGRVMDPSGAVISKATVALRDGLGNARQTTTGADGSFRLAGVPEGHYDLTVTAPGFEMSHQAIELKPGEMAAVQPVLRVGTAAQAVTVTSAAPALETESAGVGQISARLPSRLPASESVSLGKRILSLDSAGGLFLSRNAGRSWKKIKPRWTGKAVRIEAAPAEANTSLGKSEPAGEPGEERTFHLITESGAVWSSRDGSHWRPQ